MGVKIRRGDAETQRRRHVFSAVSLRLCVSALSSVGSALTDIEARARELKARGDAAGALALYEQADPKSARVQDEIGFLLAVLNRRAEALERFRARDRARSEIRAGALPLRRRVLAGAGSGARHAGVAGGGVASIRRPSSIGSFSATR